MNRFPFALLVFIVALGTTLNCRTLFAQGAITPPGAPMPTMKTLDQIEPRTILNTANCPGDALNIFIITQPRRVLSHRKYRGY